MQKCCCRLRISYQTEQTRIKLRSGSRFLIQLMILGWRRIIRLGLRVGKIRWFEGPWPWCHAILLGRYKDCCSSSLFFSILHLWSILKACTSSQASTDNFHHEVRQQPHCFGQRYFGSECILRSIDDMQSWFRLPQTTVTQQSFWCRGLRKGQSNWRCCRRKRWTNNHHFWPNCLGCCSHGKINFERRLSKY